MDRGIQKIIAAIIVWTVVIIETKKMKKIQTEDKTYQILDVMIGIISTVVLIAL